MTTGKPAALFDNPIKSAHVLRRSRARHDWDLYGSV